MVNYLHSPQISQLLVCLYDPMAEEMFTVESLTNFINDNWWQLSNGQRPRRIPFHVTAVPADATKETEEMTRIIRALRKEQNSITTEQGTITSKQPLSQWKLFRQSGQQSRG